MISLFIQSNHPHLINKLKIEKSQNKSLSYKKVANLNQIPQSLLTRTNQLIKAQKIAVNNALLKTVIQSNTCHTTATSNPPIEQSIMYK